MAMTKHTPSSARWSPPRTLKTANPVFRHEQVSIESALDSFIIVEKSNTCFDELPSALECCCSSNVDACV